MPEVILRIIQLQDGISVNIDKIEAIEKKDEFSCKVYVGTNVYKSTYPYDVLKEMLNSERFISKEPTQETEKRIERLEEVFKKAQYWAG